MIKALDTVFDGHLFRSRLEARWAVFYKALGIKYEYEPQGFELNGTKYLPDFWLPEQRCWIEIKGKSPTEEEEALMSALAAETGHSGFIFYGDIPQVESYWQLKGTDNSAFELPPSGGRDNDYCWCICRYCGHMGIEFNGRSARLPCGCRHAIDPGDDKDYSPGHPRLEEAYRIARHMRFEHESYDPQVALLPFKPQSTVEIHMITLVERHKRTQQLERALRVAVHRSGGPIIISPQEWEECKEWKSWYSITEDAGQITVEEHKLEDERLFNLDENDAA